jgi:ubiquinone/menaquinone biosynthesis C-methylase UbiE
VTQTPDFNRIARPYRWLEYLTLGPILQRTRTHFLPQLTHCRHALILGDGDGRFTAALLARSLTLHAQAVDLSPAMLALLQRNVARAGAASRLRAHHADLRTFTPDPPPDLITTHFVLDCLTQSEVDTLIAGLAPLLQPHGLWLFSDFRIPQGPLHWPARLYIRLLYLAFRILTGLRTTRLPDHEIPLDRAGLRRIARHRALCGLLTTELWQR